MKAPEIRSKDELEREKLALEIRELKRKWWQRPVYLSVLLPMVLASLTVLAGILSGYFNRERIELQRDIAALKAEKTALIRNANSLAAENKAAQDIMTELLNRINVEAIKLNKALEEERDSRSEEPKIKQKPTPSPSPN